MLISPINPYNNIYFRGQEKRSHKTIDCVSIYDVDTEDKNHTPFVKEFNKLIREDSKAATPFVSSVKNGFPERIEAKLRQHPERSIIIGITGKSASGKSTLTEKFVETMKKKGISVTVLTSDNYYQDTSHLIKNFKSYEDFRASGFEFDAPENFRLDLLGLHLIQLANGKEIRAPQPLWDGTGRCEINVNKKEPAKIVVVEGIAAHYPTVRDVVDAKVFVDLKESIRRQRFIERAPLRHPDWSYDQIMAQYNETTDTADKHIASNLNGADIVLNNGASKKDIDKFMDMLGDSILKLSKSDS